MEHNINYKFLLISFLLGIMIITQTSCANRNVTETAATLNNSNGTENAGQAFMIPQEKEENLVALEKTEAVTARKEKEAKTMELENKKADLENQIKAYLGSNISKVGLSYYDINSGEGIIINGDKTFLAASTVKVQMNMVLGDLIESGAINENENLSFTQDCYEEGTGILQSQDLSKPIPLSVLSDYSILHSDNIATNMIIKRIDFDKMRNLIDSKLGHTTDHSDNYINANDETTLLKLLYSNSSNPMYTKLIENMKNTDFHDRVDLYLPHNIVAHKIGDYGSYVNDVGIIYTDNPYILSIYTNEVDNANEVIAHISKLIYDYQNSIKEDI